MRTTVDIPDETYRDLKMKAAREGTPMRQIVLRGIQRELEGAAEKPIRKLQTTADSLLAAGHTGTDQRADR